MLDRILRPNATRAISAATLFQTGGEMPNRTLAGVNINQDNALAIGAVYASVRLISDVISTLPLDTFVNTNDQRVAFPMPAWLVDPEPDLSVTRADHIQMVLVSMLLDGNAFVRKLRNPNTGEIVALSVLAPHRVEIVRNSAGLIEYKIDQGKRVLLMLTCCTFLRCGNRASCAEFRALTRYAKHLDCPRRLRISRLNSLAVGQRPAASLRHRMK